MPDWFFFSAAGIAIATTVLSLKTFIDTRTRYYEEYVERKRR